MARILLIHRTPPLPVAHGGALRAYHLSEALVAEHQCYLAVLEHDDDSLAEVRRRGLYQDICILGKPPKATGWWRWRRLSNAHWYRRATPTYYRAAVAALKHFVEKHHIELVIAGNMNVEEVARSVAGVRTIVDNVDCLTLTHERAYATMSGSMGVASRLRARVAWIRVWAYERRLAQRHDLITTTSTADQKRLVELNPERPEAIIAVPNGVAREALEAPLEGDEEENAVAFWGNLSFPPNESAVRHFYQDIYLPYLEERGVRWYVIGPDVPRWMHDMGERHPLIHVTGFVADLFGLVRRIPVVINPMVMGSGLKNKVLEAFALRRAVVSTGMGIEAIDARADEQYVEAEDPYAFAEAVLDLLSNPEERRRLGENARRLVLEKYTWERVGRAWCALVSSLVQQKGDLTKPGREAARA